MIRRRDFLKLAGWGGMSFAFLGSFIGDRLFAQQEHPVPKIPVFSGTRPGTSFVKYLDPLPLVNVMPNTGVVNQYQVQMVQFAQKLHRDLPPTQVWGYAPVGIPPSWPGPTIESPVNVRATVRWINNLPDTHLLARAVDHTIHGAEKEFPDVRVVVHLHGGATAPQSDGYPEDWYSPGGIRITGQGHNHVDCVYDNGQLATTLWYHDHALGITRLNVMAGLAGLYVLRDNRDTGGPPSATPSNPRAGENSTGLPGPAYGHGSGPFYEIPLVIQDRALNEDGSLFYPTDGVNSDVHPQWIQDFFGDVICVNGKVWPYLNVEPRRYRFRVLNGCNSRILKLSLDSGQPIYQIGSDGGFLPGVAQLDSLLIAPAERADIIIDFTGMAKSTTTLVNNAETPLVRGPKPDPQTTGQIMQFRVVNPLDAPDRSLPPQSISLPAFDDLQQLVTPDMIKSPRRSYVHVTNGTKGPLILTFNHSRWMDPITENPRIGSVEVWEMINTAADFHPLHLHLLQFQVLNRQAFDVNAYLSALTSGSTPFAVLDPTPYLQGVPVAPSGGEAGWKDTVLNHRGTVTRIVTRWAPQGTALTGPGSSSPGVNLYPFNPAQGKYVWHCHNLEHEDNELMRPFVVLR